MKATFDDMNSQLNVVEQNLPADKLPELAEVRKKIEANQRDMIAAQENIERKRGSVEGDKYVEPKPRELGNFVSEKRGETISYSRLREDGEIGKTAFVDTGKKVEIHDWKDRQAVLAAMQVSAEKWRSLTVNGTNSYKALVVELVAEHGFHIANPELQEGRRAWLRCRPCREASGANRGGPTRAAGREDPGQDRAC
jgi:Large polyvalent protein-associated domain 7